MDDLLHDIRPGPGSITHDHIKSLAEGGWPIIPINGKKAYHASWTGFHSDRPPDDETIESWLVGKWRDGQLQWKPPHNVGILTGFVVAIDIDVEDQATADAIHQETFEVLGPTEFVRVGRHPRRQLYYRVFEEPAETRTFRKLEILGKGKQSASFGTHPDTKSPFCWSRVNPLNTGVIALPSTDQILLNALVQRLEAKFPEPMGKTSSSGGDGNLPDPVWENGLVVDHRESWATMVVYDAWSDDPDADDQLLAARAWADFVETTDLSLPRSDRFDERDFARRIKRLKRRAGKGLVSPSRKRITNNTPPHFPFDGLHDPFKAANELTKTLNQIAKDAALGKLRRGYEAVIAVGAGMGKSTKMLEAINAAKKLKPDLRVLYAVPTTSLAFELMNKANAEYGEQFSRAYPGREATLPQPYYGADEGKQTCADPSRINGLKFKPRDIQSTRCGQHRRTDNRCPHFETCTYQQLREIAGSDPLTVSFVSHERLYIEGLDRFFPKSFDFVVVDESPLNSVVVAPKPVAVHNLLSSGMLKSPTAESIEALEIVNRALEDLKEGLDPRERLLGKYTKTKLHELAKALDPQPNISPSMKGAHVKSLRKFGKHSPFASFFLSRLAEELDTEYLHGIQYVVNDTSPNEDGQHEMGVDRVYMQHKRMPKVPASTPMIYLDGTAYPTIYQHILRDIHQCAPLERRTERNIEVTQTMMWSGSSTKLHYDNDGPQQLDKIAGFIRELGPKTLVVGQVKTEEELIKRGIPAENILHFNKQRGNDRFKDFDNIVIVGRILLPMWDAERQARALLVRSAETIVPVDYEQGWPKQVRGYRLQNGRAGTEVEVHPDPLVQAIVEQSREHEITQAIDRLRVRFNEDRKRAFILTSVPVDITVKHLERFDTLIQGGPRLEQVMEALGGWVLLRPAWLVEQFPDLFKSKKAAEREIEKHLPDGQIHSVMLPGSKRPTRLVSKLDLKETIQALAQAGLQATFKARPF